MSPLTALSLLVVCVAAAATFVWRRMHETPEVFAPKKGEVCEAVRRCPSLWREWLPVPWLRSGHMQTLGVVRVRPKPEMSFDRELFRTSDGGTVGLDWLAGKVHDRDDSAPVLLVLHGMNGGSGENYLRHFVKGVTSALNCRAVVMINRGLGGVKMTSWRPYNGGFTEDVREVVGELRRRCPNAPIIAAGFSLGANVLVRYMGQEGDSCPLAAAVTCSCPFDLNEATVWVETSADARKHYSPFLVAGLKRYAMKNKEAFESCPHVKVDMGALAEVKTIRQFDDLFTGPFFGYKDAHDYYVNNSALDLIKEVRRPLLCFNARDDPITGPQVTKSAQGRVLSPENTHVALAALKTGGHLAFLEGLGFPLTNLPSWIRAEHSFVDRAACEFFAACLYH